MKTSKYIFIAYLIFFFGSVLTMYILAKTHEKSANKTVEMTVSEVELPPFSVIVMEGGAVGYIDFASKNTLTASAPKSEKPNLTLSQFRIENDTLFYRERMEGMTITLSTDQSPKIIVRDNAALTLNRNESLDTLRIVLEEGQLWSSRTPQAYAHIEVESKGSKFNFANFTVATGTFDLNTTAGFLPGTSFKHMDINMNQFSYLGIPDMTSMTMQIDSTSSIYRVITRSDKKSPEALNQSSSSQNK
ncbi:hypothetical protein [Sediminicola luteus]|uniref:Uncharacterized protein n=1 Tax=Sediminicola luteus TaxID=319238 RepID=A0A2A4G5V9_9FLAO|nr:hypothetical protein [Sediminicola luteus]PCE63344.1 hypothetical protein B7P33_14085 [Sediminicola luteus]